MTVPAEDRGGAAAGARPRAVVVRSGAGESIDAAGVRHLFLLTGGRLGVERFEVRPGTVGARPHVHREHDETFYVLTGELTLTISAPDRTDADEVPDHAVTEDVVLGPGDLAHAPRGSLHGFRNDAAQDTAVALCLYTPPGYEQYFRDVHAAAAEGRELDDTLLAQLRAHHATDTP